MACRVGYNGDIKNQDWGGFVDSNLDPPVNPSSLEVPPHYLLIGPASGATPGLATFRLAVPADFTFAAILAQPNVFTDVNSFNGIRFLPVTVASDYTLTQHDSEVLVDASGGAVVITLPEAIGDGQFYRIKKIDATGNTVLIVPQSGDFIDGDTGILLQNEWDGCVVIDADTAYWDSMLVASPAAATDVAHLSIANIFAALNTFTGVRFSARTVVADDDITDQDFEILGDASGGTFTLTLPPATGSGQIYHVKKIDGTANVLTISAQSGELIDGSASLSFISQYTDTFLIDSSFGSWDAAGGSFTLPSNVALTDAANVFTEVNTFTGLRLATAIKTSDYTVTPDDFEILGDATSGDIAITLPPATGSGQYYRFKKIDSTGNIVSINAVGSDLIDGSISLNFFDQYADAQLLDAAPGYWDNTGSAATGGGGSADFGINGRVRDLDPIHGFAFDVLDVDNVTWVEQVRYTLPASSPAPVTSVTWWYKPEITNTTELAAFPTLGNQEFSRMDVLFDSDPDLGSGFKIFILKSGAADGGDPGQVAPADYDSGTNDFHWESAI